MKKEENAKIIKLKVPVSGSLDAVKMEGKCILSNFDHGVVRSSHEVNGKVICSISEGIFSAIYTHKKEHKMMTFKIQDIMEAIKAALDFNKEVVKHAGK